MWLTDEAVEAPYAVWAELASQFAETRLWPVIWVRPDAANLDPQEPPGVIRSVEELLSEQWRLFIEFLGEGADSFIDGQDTAFPGLARPESECSFNALDDARNVDTPAIPIALFAVERPADVPVVSGWNETVNFERPADITAVLRSWEDRFGAYLYVLAPLGMELLVERPPRDVKGRLAWTAERIAFSDELALDSDTLADYATFTLRDEPAVPFQWD